MDLGPKIPVKASVIGNVTSNIKTDLEEYGINNTLLKIYINVEININFIMPFVSQNIKVENEVPLVVKLINGRIPSVYGGSYSVASSLTNSWHDKRNKINYKKRTRKGAYAWKQYITLNQFTTQNQKY